MDLHIKLIISLFLFIFSCNNKQMIIDEKIEGQEKLYSLFKTKTLIRGGERDKSLLIIKSYKDDLTNEYYFKNNGVTYLLDRDSIQFSEPPLIQKHSKIIDSSTLELVKTLDEYEINSISSDLRKQGIDLKIYLNDGTNRLYVLNPKQIENNIFSSYFIKAKKMNENWYSVNE